MFSQQQSKQDLEKIYNKGQVFREDIFEQQFRMKPQEVKQFNDRLQEANQYDERIEDSDIINIEATNLLSTDLNLKYSSPLKNTQSRITSMRSLLILIHTLVIIYFIYVIVYLDNLVSLDGTIKYLAASKRTNFYFDFLPTGLKIIYGSQATTMCIYIVGIIVYHVHLMLAFIPTSTYEEDTNDSFFTHQFILNFRQKTTWIFIAYTCVLTVGQVSQLFLYHYRKGLQAFLVDSKKHETIQLLIFGMMVLLIQFMKIAIQIVIILLTKRLKQYCIKYTTNMNNLKFINKQ